MAIIVIFDSWMDLWNLWQERWTNFQDLYPIDPATDIKRICMIRIMQYTLQCNGPAWDTALSAECTSEKCDIVIWSYRKSPAFEIIFYAFILWELLAGCPIDCQHLFTYKMIQLPLYSTFKAIRICIFYACQKACSWALLCISLMIAVRKTWAETWIQDSTTCIQWRWGYIWARIASEK